ncbi:hypothetical protein HPP92_016175 [Vanilla planifolia]|uniref:Uncharacterized protein n=1 Tax=Vanilla planifolia TaxID=51239 RepID=A0A835QBI7_VANPL|nr:hypothetical protein HPP92_016776 [Vanilla planifolia]KAG0471629.1 hypothetical protein HPP92_016175 [Vanilla planifolia]
MSRMEQDNSRLSGAHRLAKEENSKLRDIIKQAVNEATVVKESLEIARFENYELNEQLSKKEAALQQIRHDYESLKASDAAYRYGVMEPKRPPASASEADANVTSTLSNVDSVRQSNVSHENKKITKDETKFPSDGWTNENHRPRNGRRHSVGETDTMKSLAFETQDAIFASISIVQDGPVSSSLFTHDRGLTADGLSHSDGVYNDSDNEKQKKKKTVFRRFGDALRRRSFRKT